MRNRHSWQPIAHAGSSVNTAAITIDIITQTGFVPVFVPARVDAPAQSGSIEPGVVLFPGLLGLPNGMQTITRQGTAHPLTRSTDRHGGLGDQTRSTAGSGCCEASCVSWSMSGAATRIAKLRVVRLSAGSMSSSSIRRSCMDF